MRNRMQKVPASIITLIKKGQIKVRIFTFRTSRSFCYDKRNKHVIQVTAAKIYVSFSKIQTHVMDSEFMSSYLKIQKSNKKIYLKQF